MLQHVRSHVDGDVSVAALRMPAEAGPFVKAILEICAPLLVGHSLDTAFALSSCSLLALTAFTVRLCGSQTLPMIGLRGINFYGKRTGNVTSTSATPLR